MKINICLSEELAQLVEAENKTCYKNSVLALLILGERPEAKEPVYVEGGAIAYRPEAHGWIENRDEIIDVTYFGRNFRYTHDRSFEPHEPPEQCRYFPGRKYSLAEVQRLLSTHKKLPFFEIFTGETRTKQIEAMKAAYKSPGVVISKVHE